jgi:endo-1,4-beta-xylanase
MQQTREDDKANAPSAILKSADSRSLLVEMSGSSAARAGRRNFLKYVGAAVVAAATGLTVGRYAWTPVSPETVTQTSTRTMTLTATVAETVTEAPSCSSSLRAAAEANGLLIGSEADETSFEDMRFAPVLAREFNSLSPGWEMKWGQVDRRGYGPADALVRFASDHQMKAKGHCLIWHTNLPAWINSQMSANELRLAMQKHIREEVAHYRGKVYAWDVVNEAVDDREGLRKTVFLEKLGEGYIAEAFQLAHEADPDALLFYNDYDAEAAGSDRYWSRKSDRVYELVRKLVADGVPIHGVGLQMHLMAWDYPKPEDIAANVRRLAALGLKVAITEMDVRIKDLPGSLPERLEVQRRVYRDVIAACLKESAFMGITFWGFTDAHSWINEPGRWGPDYPLLFDENYQPKPAYWGVMDALLGR